MQWVGPVPEASMKASIEGVDEDVDETPVKPR